MHSLRKVALVTGSGTGVGAATALALALRGYNLLINYSKSVVEAQQSATACREAGAETLLLRGDVSVDADCRAMAQAVAEKWGRLDALVNNAGISVFGESATWDALDAEAFQRVLGVNTLGAFQMVRACLPQLKAAQGSIVNVSSVAGVLRLVMIAFGEMPFVPMPGAAVPVASCVVWMRSTPRSKVVLLVLPAASVAVSVMVRRPAVVGLPMAGDCVTARRCASEATARLV